MSISRRIIYSKNRFPQGLNVWEAFEPFKAFLNSNLVSKVNFGLVNNKLQDEFPFKKQFFFIHSLMFLKEIYLISIKWLRFPLETWNNPIANWKKRHRQILPDLAIAIKDEWICQKLFQFRMEGCWV